MKTIQKLTILWIMALIPYLAKSQAFDSIVMQPKNPSINDSIAFIIYNVFGQSGCSMKTHNLVINNNNISNISSYCIGNYQGGCNDIDSIKIPPLSAGSYVFQYTLKYNQYYYPCDTFIDLDYIEYSFIVEQANGITKEPFDKESFSVKMNDKNKIEITLNQVDAPVSLTVYSSQGEKIFHKKLIYKLNELDMRLKDGFYIFCINSRDKRFTKKVFVNSQ